METKRSKRLSTVSRDAGRAGRLVLYGARTRKQLSFGSQKTHGAHWERFIEWMSGGRAIRPEQITREHLLTFGEFLRQQVDDDEISIAYAHNLISSCNTVLKELLPHPHIWETVSPTKDCGLPKRCAVRLNPPDGLVPGVTESAILAIRSDGRQREAAMIALIDAFGLRLREALLLDAAQALTEARAMGSVTIAKGTKGGKSRRVPASWPRQLASLATAAALQGEDNCLIPTHQTYESFLNREISRIRPILKSFRIACPRELRAAWAVRRYRELAGFWPPLIAGTAAPDRDLDRRARLQLASELGHAREEVTNEYVGGQAPRARRQT